MKRMTFFILLVLPICGLFAQDSNDTVLVAKTQDSIVDNNYREDQFYVSITYNLLENKPGGISQSGFSSGFHLGFIRDMPINDKRNLAIGIGLGLSTNSYNQTLLISEVNDGFNYSVIDGDVSFSKNKFTTYLIEVPVEFRWRTSTATDFDFWRIYGGIKFGYVVHNSSKFNGSPSDIKLSNIDHFNSLQYGLTLSAGYSNVNFHLYYGLNSIFDGNARLESNGNGIDMNAVKIGLMFYIL
jgi:hypothetical protein